MENDNIKQIKRINSSIVPIEGNIRIKKHKLKKFG